MTDNPYPPFLKELTELTKKHGIYIDGCGCCGSPMLEELPNRENPDIAKWGYTVSPTHDNLLFERIEDGNHYREKTGR